MVQNNSTPKFGEYQNPPKRSFLRRAIPIVGLSLLAILLIVAVGGYFYLQSLKKTPQYSLALIVEAAKKDDKKQIEELIDTDAVIDDFMPQITDKAIEIYGRNLPKDVISRVTQIALPMLPKVKEAAKAELPRVIRDKTKQAEDVPFWAIVFGADRFLDVSNEGEIATIKSKIPEKQLELRMKRVGDKWKIIGMKDDKLATQIAQKVGQQILAIASKDGIENIGKQLGVNGFGDIMKQLEGVFK
jgi:hypothetical protein